MEVKKEYLVVMYQVMKFGLEVDDAIKVTDIVFSQLLKDEATFDTEKENYDLLIKGVIGKYFYEKNMEENGYRVITLATKDFKKTVPELIKELATLIDNSIDIDLTDVPERILKATDLVEEAITNLDVIGKKFGKKFGISSRVMYKTEK